MKTAEEKADRYANLMIAVAVIAGVYSLRWRLTAFNRTTWNLIGGCRKTYKIE